MNKTIEKIIYSLGVNGSIYDLGGELEMLKVNLPKKYLHRRVTDIGCGNGVVTLKLQKILLPENLQGVDLSPSLIKSARKQGLVSRVLDVENQSLTGDLGVLWGVLHHFCNPSTTLQKIYEHFNSLIIRESISTKRIFELGHRFNYQKLMEIFAASGIKPSKIIEVKNSQSLIFFIDHP